MLTLECFSQREREHLICLLRSIDADALATVFDPRDAMIADNAKAKMIVMLEDAVLNVRPDAARVDCTEKISL